MAFRIRQPVRHPDVDRAGIVYFPRFYDFFHRALEDFFTVEVGIPVWDLADRLKVAMPVVHIETDFERPLQHGDALSTSPQQMFVGACRQPFGEVGREIARQLGGPIGLVDRFQEQTSGPLPNHKKNRG